MLLKNKSTGKLYKITVGKVLKPREVKKKDITASFITAVNVENETEEVGVVLGYKKDGTLSDKNEFTVEEE